MGGGQKKKTAPGPPPPHPVSSKARSNENGFFSERVKIIEPEWKEREIHFNYINDIVAIKCEESDSDRIIGADSSVSDGKRSTSS